MKYKLTIKEEAALEIMDSYRWYEEQQENLGERFLDTLESCYNQILENPEIYRKQYKSFRQCIAHPFPFVIIYEIEQKDIVVYSVFHTSRNPENKPL